jgi:hypothetical protein
MKEFKIRASACGEIMTNARSKTETLSKTAQTYCQTWVKEQLYDRQKRVVSKYMDKGNIVEDNAIDLYAEIVGLPILLKNEQYFEDNFMSGTPDIILQDKVVDVKSSWDCFTFPLFDPDPPDNYFYQGQVYMHLTGIHRFHLAYCLIDTPEHLIEQEAYSHCRRTGESFEEVIDDFTDNMTYSGLENDLRIKVYSFEYDAAVIERIRDRVIECRKYIETLK